MATAAVKKPYVGQVQEAQVRSIRIVLSSTKLKNLENLSTQLIEGAKNLRLKVAGPVRLPTKTLRLTVRKSPCGNGTATFDRFEMRIHKRVITLQAPSDVITKLTANVQIDAGVNVEIMLTQ